MGVLQHDGLVVERWMSFNLPPVNETTIIVINQIKIVAFPRIVPQPEVPDEFILGIYILDKNTGGELGAKHDQCLHVDRMDVEQVVGFPVRKSNMIKLVTRGEDEAG
ncbi:MAG: hypothetical protein MUO54_16610 [Anaerolineales bacterium]|nr:hypothetical protein [Anaerolineales bacterium]